MHPKSKLHARWGGGGKKGGGSPECLWIDRRGRCIFNLDHFPFDSLARRWQIPTWALFLIAMLYFTNGQYYNQMAIGNYYERRALEKASGDGKGAKGKGKGKDE